jgi:hypothetical protein
MLTTQSNFKVPVTVLILPKQVIGQGGQALAQLDNELIVGDIVYHYVHAVEDLIQVRAVVLENACTRLEQVAVPVDVFLAFVVAHDTFGVISEIFPPLLSVFVVFQLLGEVIDLEEINSRL